MVTFVYSASDHFPWLPSDLGYCPVPATDQPVKCNIYRAALPQQGVEDQPLRGPVGAEDEDYSPGLGQYFIDRKLWPRVPHQEGEAEHPLAHHHIFVTKHVIYDG